MGDDYIPKPGSRWLCEDHTDPEVRERVRSICQSIPTRSLSGVRLDIDANMHA